MAIQVEIDSRSGFCGGVIRAIESAEKYLDSHPGEKLLSLGAIVHNEEELSRLSQKGLTTVSLGELEPSGGGPLLVRAHGEPPSTYERARELGYQIIDCTCPVVLKLQASIRDAYARLHAGGKSGQIVLFGKVGHAEVLGLAGQVNGDVVIVESLTMLEQAVSDGSLRLDVPLEIFSQTTKSPDEYSQICNWLRKHSQSGISVHMTICSQVAVRHSGLTAFALAHDVILFVSGRESSNGRVLCDLCKSVNIRTYHIGSPDDIKRAWFAEDDRVGVCGATSTPKWLLEQVAAKVRTFNAY